MCNDCGNPSVTHIHKKSGMYNVTLKDGCSFAGKGLTLASGLSCVPLAEYCRGPSVRYLVGQLPLGRPKPGSWSNEHLKTIQKEAKRIAAEARAEWVKANPEEHEAGLQVRIVRWRGVCLVEYPTSVCVHDEPSVCAKGSVLRRGRRDGEQQYTDPDTGWVESADDWNTHDGEVKVPKPLRILPERRNDKEAIANVECLLRADAEWLWKTKICRQDDDARAAQNARNRESYAEKKKAREAVFDAGIDIPEAPSADAFVQGLQIEATLLKNPEVAAFVSVYKGTADPKEGKGGVIEWKVRKYEERGTFSAPGRVNHVLTPGGYHFLNRDMQLLRNLKCPKGKAGFNSKFSVVAGGNDGAFEREKQLITALEERKKLAESVSDRIIILNCVGGGNGSRSIGGAGCAGISVLYATPNQVRFNKMGNEEHQCNIRNQAPLSFRQLVDMNDKKLATIAKPKKSTEKRRAKRAEEEKRTKEQRRDELNSKRAGKSATPKPFNTKRKASPTSVSDPDFDSASATEKQSGSKAVKQASSSSAKQSKAKRSVPSRKSPSAAKKQASISSAQQPESSVAVSRKKPPVAVKPSTAPSKQPECPGAPAEAKKLPVSSEKKRPEAAVASDNPPPAKKQKSEKEEAKKSNFFGVRK